MGVGNITESGCFTFRPFSFLFVVLINVNHYFPQIVVREFHPTTFAIVDPHDDEMLSRLLIKRAASWKNNYWEIEESRIPQASGE
jgi:hypothetical protein